MKNKQSEIAGDRLEPATIAALTQEQLIDLHLDKVLRASGSALRYYSMAKTLAEMRAAMKDAMAAGTGRLTNRVFIDMDGVVVDFDRYMRDNRLSAAEVKKQNGAYLAMPAIPGALDAIRRVIALGYEVWIATKPPTGVSFAYSDKAAWIFQNLPELSQRIVITHNKGFLGGAGDYLCDDRPHKADCEAFRGTLLRFVDGFHWPEALEILTRDAIKRELQQRVERRLQEVGVEFP